MCHLLRHPEDTAPAAGGPLAAAAHCTRCEGRAEGGRFGRLPLARSKPAEGFAVPSLGVPRASCSGEGRRSCQGAGETGGADAPAAAAPHAVQHPAAQFADAAAHSPLWLPRQGGGSRDPSQIPPPGVSPLPSLSHSLPGHPEAGVPAAPTDPREPGARLLGRWFAAIPVGIPVCLRPLGPASPPSVRLSVCLPLHLPLHRSHPSACEALRLPACPSISCSVPPALPLLSRYCIRLPLSLSPPSSSTSPSIHLIVGPSLLTLVSVCLFVLPFVILALFSVHCPCSLGELVPIQSIPLSIPHPYSPEDLHPICSVCPPCQHDGGVGIFLVLPTLSPQSGNWGN